MPSAQVFKNAVEYAAAVGAHARHETYRADRPFDRLIGKGCKTCSVEHFISIADFKATGDLEAYDKEWVKFAPPEPKEKKK